MDDDEVVQFVFRMPEELRERLRRVAAEHDLSMTQVVRSALRRQLDWMESK